MASAGSQGRVGPSGPKRARVPSGVGVGWLSLGLGNIGAWQTAGDEPELNEAVERASTGAREVGELLDPPTEPFRSPLSPEVQSVLREWRDSGEFDRALAEVIADDPELADQ